MKRFFFQVQKIDHKTVKVLKRSVLLHTCVRNFFNVNLALYTQNKSNKILPNGQKNQ